MSKSARSTRTLRQLFVRILQGRRQLQVQAVSRHEIASLCIWTTLFSFFSPSAKFELPPYLGLARVHETSITTTSVF